MTRRVGAQRPRLELLPDGVTSSAAEEAIALAKTCGMELDDWQRWCLHWMLSERTDGSWAATQSVLIQPRQNGKSALFEVILLAALYLFGERKIIYSAHLAKTSSELMTRLTGLIRGNPDLAAVTQFYVGNGKESIKRKDTGAVIEFVTRGKRTVRGGSPQRVIFDEALFLTDPQIQAILPGLSAQSLNAEGAPQFMFGSSAPLDDSEVLLRLRATAIAGDMPRTFFAEWSCDPECDPRDRENWYQANPGLGVRISEEWVEQNELAILSPEAFAVERLGIVMAETRQALIPAKLWNALRDRDSVAVDPVAFAVEVSEDRDWSVIAVAGRSGFNGTHVEIVDIRSGVDWVQGRLVELCAKWSPVGVGIRSAGPAGSLVPALTAAGLPVSELTARDYARACSDFFDAVQASSIVHRGDDALNAAVGAAARKSSGSASESWVWDRRRHAVQVEPLLAVTVARWVATTVQPEPVAAGSTFYFPDLED